MLVGVILARLFSMMSGVQMVTVRQVGMMTTLLMIACFVVISRRSMMLRRGLMVLGSLLMIFYAMF